jgi:hypothetical protein
MVTVWRIAHLRHPSQPRRNGAPRLGKESGVEAPRLVVGRALPTSAAVGRAAALSPYVTTAEYGKCQGCSRGTSAALGGKNLAQERCRIAFCRYNGPARHLIVRGLAPVSR